jgi:hypothetical protein
MMLRPYQLAALAALEAAEAIADHPQAAPATDSAKARLRRETNAGRAVKLSELTACVTKRWPELAGCAAAVAERAAREFASRSRYRGVRANGG